eukprot:gene13137-biopygen23023
MCWNNDMLRYTMPCMEALRVPKPLPSCPRVGIQGKDDILPTLPLSPNSPLSVPAPSINPRQLTMVHMDGICCRIWERWDGSRPWIDPGSTRGGTATRGRPGVNQGWSRGQLGVEPGSTRGRADPHWSNRVLPHTGDPVGGDPPGARPHLFRGVPHGGMRWDGMRWEGMRWDGMIWDGVR